MALAGSFSVNGVICKPTIFAIQFQAAYVKALIFVAEARIAVQEGNFIWAAIASYYSLFHLATALVYATPQLIDSKSLTKLVKKRGSHGQDDPTNSIRHSDLPKFLTQCEVHGLTPELGKLFGRAQKMREEYANYGPRIVWRKEVPTFLTHGYRPSDVQNIVKAIAPLIKKSVGWVRKQNSSPSVALIWASISLESYLKDKKFHYAIWCSKKVLADAESLRKKLSL